MGSQRLQLTWYNKDMALIPTEDGRYGYSWVDPADPRYCETRVLEFDEYVEGGQTPKQEDTIYSERADLEPQTDNLMVLGESGDVLEALTRTPELAERYVGKVKLVYIDPPFNTAQTFASYEDNLEHSIWLTMMRDRLLNLKRLLSDDGSIWVHLDDVEVHRMRLLLDEIFGSDNFVAEMIWENAYSPKSNGSSICTSTDFILVYSKSSFFTPNRLKRTTEMNSRYKNIDNDIKGPWTNDNPCANHNVGRRQHPGVYGIQHPVTGLMMYPPQSANWRFAQDTVLELMKEWGNYSYGEVTADERANRQRIEGKDVEIRDDVKPLVIKDWSQKDIDFALERYAAGNWPVYWFTKGGYGGIRRKSYLNEVADRVPVNLMLNNEVGHNDGAKKEIKNLFDNVKPFSTPKPERLLERIIHIGSNPGDIILDVFAGSGTTAAVAQKMGRRWVTCELLEETFNTFTRPRLEKVINDNDQGGITRTDGERVAADNVDLPYGVSPDDAATFTSVLNKLIAENPQAKKDPLIKELKAASKTKKSKEVINWRGGGGFQVAHLASACFDYDEELDRTILTEAATGDLLVKSVAANLGFSLLDYGDWEKYDGYYFDGYRGNTVLKVWEGIADNELVDWLVSRLHEGQNMILATTQTLDGVREYLRKLRRGSRLIVVPDELFPYAKGGM